MRKGISPIVAVVLLIAIAVVAAVSIYFWAGGITTKQPTPKTPIPIVANPISNGRLLVTNLGQKTVNMSKVQGTSGEVVCEKGTLSPGETVSCQVKGNVNQGSTITIYGSGTGSSTVTVSGEVPPAPGTQTWNATIDSGYYDNAEDLTRIGDYLYVPGTYGGNVSLLKYDLNGNAIWNRTWDGGGSDVAYGSCSDGEYIYLVGQVKNYDKALLMKYGQNGNLIFAKTFDYGSNNDVFWSCVADNNYIYIVGQANGTPTLIKFNSDGTIVWETTISGISGQIAKIGDFVYIPDGSNVSKFDINGNKIKSIEFPTPICITTDGSYIYVGGYTGTVAKLDPDLNIIWERNLGNGYLVAHCSTYGYSIYCTGDYFGTTRDMFVVRYDKDGNLMWKYIWDTGTDEVGRGIVPTENYVYVAGGIKHSTLDQYLQKISSG